MTNNELRSLTTLTRRGANPARVQTRARILMLLHRDRTPDAVAAALVVGVATVFNVKHRYLSGRLAAAPHDKPRSGKPASIDGAARARITALACSAAPEGHARWTLRLLADKAVELGLVESISHNTVKEALKKTASSTGRRLVETSRRRTKADYCRFIQRVAAFFPAAEKVVLVQDNLNTHNASSFYENLPATEAFALAQRFEMHYTPKKGSWLNMAELELSALSRICLSRRIGSVEEFDRGVQALVKERNELKVKVEWQFSVSQAREKLSRHYEDAKPKN